MECKATFSYLLMYFVPQFTEATDIITLESVIFREHDVSPIAQVPNNLFPDKNSPITKSPIDPTPRQAQVPDCKPNPNSPIGPSPRLTKSPIAQPPDTPKSPILIQSQLPDRPKAPIAQVPDYLFPDKNSPIRKPQIYQVPDRPKFPILHRRRLLKNTAVGTGSAQSGV